MFNAIIVTHRVQIETTWYCHLKVLLLREIEG